MGTRKGPPLTYANNCVDWPRRYVRELTDMIDGERAITRRTFVDQVDKSDLAYLEGLLGYTSGFRMDTDWHVTYHSGTLFGERCYYFKHSAIEYVFAPRTIKEKLTCEKHPVPCNQTEAPADG